MNKILGYVLTILSIIMFIILVICMILIKKDYMKYLLLIFSYSSVILFFIGVSLSRKGQNKNEK